MSIIYYDPREYIKMIQQILASDTKRIGFLFGAGSSIACRSDAKESNIPGVKEMTNKIIDNITEEKYKKALEQIKTELKADNQEFYIEYAQRKFPIEIFTTNYDYLFEIALENHFVPYFDGFIGSFQPFFFSSALEDLTNGEGVKIPSRVKFIKMSDSPKSSDPKVSEEWSKERPKIAEYSKAIEYWRDQKLS